MIKVTLHAGGVAGASLFNMLGKLDFGYEKLDAVADYKAELFACGVGAYPMAFIKDYPRWSASIWDLVARIVCQSLYLREELPELPWDWSTKDRAYARKMSAVVEHWADGEQTRRARIGTAEITMGTRRCNYTCVLWDDLTGERESEMFRHAPEVLTHWDLLCRAINWTDHGQWQLPARPPLLLPTTFEHEGATLVSLGKLRQPARDGIRRWLADQELRAREVADMPSGAVDEGTFTRFLRSAI